MRAVPVSEPIAALTRPACPAAALSAVNLPSATVPFRFSSVQVAAPGFGDGVAFRVERAHRQRNGLPGLHDELGRRDDQHRGGARRRRPRHRVAGGAGFAAAGAAFGPIA